ncbi:hypothetical protein ANCCEY_01932 [Ancylostoma ceylanicum]|uniref:Retrotransposon gag domain-containing protein n=1 Tax=Ancylostoma ceylanicum TaxID=53326 RepID=A0A0D6MCI6_9BILA|nr:hypothetical protein ANCCEY_01932 [Ancylostoma ceylanicum]
MPAHPLVAKINYLIEVAPILRTSRPIKPPTEEEDKAMRANLQLLPLATPAATRNNRIARLSDLLEELHGLRLSDISYDSLRHHVYQIMNTCSAVYNGTCAELLPKPRKAVLREDMDSTTRDSSPIMAEEQPIYHSYKILGDRVEKFSGAGDKTFEEFLEEYTDLINRFKIPHEHAKSLLPLYLVGGAKLKYQNLDGADKLSWKDLVTTLATKFESEAILSNVRDELHNLTQGRDTVGDFAKKVFAKTKVAFQGQNKNMITQLAIDFFVKGLRPDIRKAIRRLPDATNFETVVANAEKEARILEQEKREDSETPIFNRLDIRLEAGFEHHLSYLGLWDNYEVPLPSNLMKFPVHTSHFTLARVMEMVIYDFYSDLFDSHVHLPPCHLREGGYVIPSVLPSEVRHAIKSVENHTAPVPTGFDQNI